MGKNIVYKVTGKKKGKKIVYESESLIDCFDFVITIARKEKQKIEKQKEQELQNFLDFGIME